MLACCVHTGAFSQHAPSDAATAAGLAIVASADPTTFDPTTANCATADPPTAATVIVTKPVVHVWQTEGTKRVDPATAAPATACRGHTTIAQVSVPGAAPGTETPAASPAA